MAKILLVEDEEALRRSMRRRLEVERHLVLETQSVPVAVNMVQEDDPALIITDINLGSESGIDLVHQLRGLGYRGGIIVITAYGTIDNAVKAVRNGADEFLQKPIGLEELMLAVERTLDRRRIANRLNLYERIDRFTNQPQQMLGQSKLWKQALDVATKTAAASQRSNGDLAVILLEGEIGTGKETLARSIHADSTGKSGPFVHIKCFALSEGEIEKELFGSSAFEKTGLFELARHGSVFLEEIGELPLPLQSRLLALLANQAEESSASNERVDGGNARLIVSTSQNLEQRITEGLFRQDLFFYLNALAIELPPLRHRGEDIILLAEHFLAEHEDDSSQGELRFANSALAALRKHHWPGNVREIQNVIQRAVLLSSSKGVISAADLGLDALSTKTGESGGDANSGTPQARSKIVTVDSAKQLRFDFSAGAIKIDDLECELLKAAIRETGGNISRAAKLVGMTRSGLRYRVERHDLRHLIEEMAPK